MSQVDQAVDKLGPLMALLQSAEEDLASSRDELERLVGDAQEALVGDLESGAVARARPGVSAELVHFWAGVSARLDNQVEGLASRQRDVLALVDAALERTTEESDAHDADDAQTKPGVWGACWEPPALAAAPIEGESDPQSVASGSQRLARVLLVLGSTLILVALLLLVV